MSTTRTAVAVAFAALTMLLATVGAIPASAADGQCTTDEYPTAAEAKANYANDCGQPFQETPQFRCDWVTNGWACTGPGTPSASPAAAPTPDPAPTTPAATPASNGGTVSDGRCTTSEYPTADQAKANYNNDCGQPFRNTPDFRCDWATNGWVCTGPATAASTGNPQPTPAPAPDPAPAPVADSGPLAAPEIQQVVTRPGRLELTISTVPGADRFNVYIDGVYFDTSRSATRYVNSNMPRKAMSVTVSVFDANGQRFSPQSAPSDADTRDNSYSTNLQPVHEPRLRYQPNQITLEWKDAPNSQADKYNLTRDGEYWKTVNAGGGWYFIGDDPEGTSLYGVQPVRAGNQFGPVTYYFVPYTSSAFYWNNLNDTFRKLGLPARKHGNHQSVELPPGRTAAHNRLIDNVEDSIHDELHANDDLIELGWQLDDARHPSITIGGSASVGVGADISVNADDVGFTVGGGIGLGVEGGLTYDYPAYLGAKRRFEQQKDVVLDRQAATRAAMEALEACEAEPSCSDPWWQPDEDRPDPDPDEPETILVDGVEQIPPEDR